MSFERALIVEVAETEFIYEDHFRIRKRRRVRRKIPWLYLIFTHLYAGQVAHTMDLCRILGHAAACSEFLNLLFSSNSLTQLVIFVLYGCLSFCIHGINHVDIFRLPIHPRCAVRGHNLTAQERQILRGFIVTIFLASRFRRTS